MKPDVQLIAITLADGSLAVMQFVTHSPRDDWRREPTRENVASEIEKAGLRAKGWRLISPEDVPSSREYREAWTDSGTRIEHDMGKARNLHRDKLRIARAPLLARLDVEYQRADEEGHVQQKRAVAVEKQRLRDVTADPRIEAAETVGQLASVGLE